MAFARSYALNTKEEVGFSGSTYGKSNYHKLNNSFGELGLSKSARKNLLIGAGVAAAGTGLFFGGKAAGWWGQPKSQGVFTGEQFGPPAPATEAFGPPPPPVPVSTTAAPINTPAKSSGFLPVLKGGASFLGSIFGAKPVQAATTPGGPAIAAKQASIFSPVMGVSLLLLGGAVIMLVKKKRSSK